MDKSSVSFPSRTNQLITFVFRPYRADYIAWNGANSDLCKGSQSLAKGPNPALRPNRMHQTQGTKSELCKGPNANLVKGSIYAQLKMQQIANVKCNWTYQSLNSIKRKQQPVEIHHQQEHITN